MINIKNTVKIIALLLAITLVLSFVCGCNNQEDAQQSILTDVSSEQIIEEKVLKIGCEQFSFIFNPFYATSESDKSVVALTSVHLLTFERSGNLIENAIDGKTVSYNGYEYAYNGIANVKYNKFAKDDITIDINIRQGVKFSDGKEITVDDVIFTMYVLLDASYNGPCKLNTLSVLGYEEYIGGFMDNIEGIIRVDDYSLTVKLTKDDNKWAEKLNINVSPLHYYGNTELYDYSSNKFGFARGDVGFLNAKMNDPFGAGPYVLEYFNEGIAYFKSNPYYFKGDPEIKQVELCMTSSSELLTGVINGGLDIATLDMDYNAIDNLEKINGGNINGDIVKSYPFEINGYGYIGINAENVSVGDDRSSLQSKALRKALMTLFASYREQLINGYYSGYFKLYNPCDIIPYKVSDEVVEYPILQTVDLLMTAGYTFDETKGIFIDAPQGASLTFDVTIVADKPDEHPAYQIFKRAKNDLNSIGITLQIKVIDTVEELTECLTLQQVQIWASSKDILAEDSLYRSYHSSNIDKINGSTLSNYYAIKDSDLDNIIIIDVVNNKDTSKISECFEIIYDWAVELPLYKRQKITLVNNFSVNTTGAPLDFTRYSTLFDNIESIRMK